MVRKQWWNMTPEEWAEYYPQLLDFYFKVVNSLKGKPLSDNRKKGCENLATKIFFHAASLYQLSKGTNVILSEYPAGAHVIDFPSMLVITRSIIETYLSLFEVFFEPKSDDEFQYRNAVYEINGLRISEIFRPPGSDVELNRRRLERVRYLKELRRKIKATSIYKGLDKNQKKATLNGKMYPERNFVARGQAAGFGKFIEQQYAFLSSYVHGTALSALQIVSATTNTEKSHFVTTCFILSMPVLSLVIINYARTFQEALNICKANRDHFFLAITLAKISSSMNG